MLSTIIVLSIFLNACFAAIEHNDIGVVEDIKTAENNNNVEYQQSMLRRRLMNGVLTDSDKLTILELHNSYRGMTARGETYGQPSAINMNELVWDEGLAKTAQSYSAQCNWAHNSNRVKDVASNANLLSFDYTNQAVGENLFITSGTESIDVLLRGIQYWYEEYAYYTYGTVSGSAGCVSGQQCGHYTQLTWAKTRYVGCGYTKCASTTGVSITNGLLFVCNYYFAGNVVGYAPYQQGPSASSCPADKPTANDGLCSGCANRAWDTYCCEYCSSTQCSNALTQGLLTSPATCTDGLGTTTSTQTTSTTTTTTTTTTTKAPTTQAPTTQAPTTQAPTTQAPTTKAPTTQAPTTTKAPTTQAPTTQAPTTQAPTQASTTKAPTTQAPTTQAPTTQIAVESAPSTSNGCCKATNNRYALYCASIVTSSVCGRFSVCNWSDVC